LNALGGRLAGHADRSPVPAEGRGVMPHQRHSIHCIVPPIVLEKIAKDGSEQQRKKAIDTMARDQTLRAARVHNLARRRSNGGGGIDALSISAGGSPNRTIYDAKNTEDLIRAVVAREEGSAATNDEAVDEAYDGLGSTYEFLWEVFDRNSIDDEGFRLDGVVHFGDGYDNAFWDGQRMVFGDGDGELFNRFTASLDVIGHELGHGVTEDEAGLEYFQQSGALNEAMSDVMGSMVKQYKLDQTAEQADWLIGAELLGPAVTGDALRSMKAPGTAYDDDVLGKDPQPAHMRDYVETMGDNGGVHINSGIPNHAFYRLAIALGGNSWDRAGRIWYEALRDPKVKPTVGFRGFARATLRNAERIFAEDDVADAVWQSWDQVGIRLRYRPSE
jgi:Zn-dependent metalloprotease